MKSFLVAYELELPKHTLKDVERQLRSFGAIRLLESVWLVQGDSSIETLAESLGLVTDINDRIVIVETTGQWYFYRPLEGILETFPS